MPLEIERKFLVISSAYKENAKTSQIKQVYLFTNEKMGLRIRIDNMQSSFAIKAKVSDRVNKEYEYNIPIDEARSIMQLDKFPVIIKTRYTVEFAGHAWEVDEFHGDNQGLVVAEIELNNEDEKFDFPLWLG